MRKSLVRTLLAGACLTPLALNANVIQYFTGIAYSNPAELFQTEQTTAILGITGIALDARFTGSSMNFLTMRPDYGTSNSRTGSLLPYGRLAKRLTPTVVAAFDITQPFHSNLDWGTDAFTRFAGTQNWMRDYDFSPKLSWQATQNLVFGGGLNFNYVQRNEINWAMPISPTTAINMHNISSSWGVGWNAGVFYALNQTNLFSAAYYSKISQKTRGYSQLGAMMNPQFDARIDLPATAILSYVHIFNPKWLINAKAFYSEWSANQNFFFNATAAPPPIGPNFTFPALYENTWAYLLATHYQVDEKTGFTLLGMVDYGPERDFLRPITFPSDTRFFVAVGADMKITKHLTLDLLYGYGFSDTRTQNQLTQGPIRIRADVVDLKLTYKA